MENVYKDSTITLPVSATTRAAVRTNVTYFSYDIGTAKQIFILEKNGQPLPLTEVDDLTMVLQFAGVDSTIHLSPEIESIEDGIVSMVLPMETLGFEGSVIGGLFIKYSNGQSLDIGYFTFNMRVSSIEANVGEMADFYVQRFEELRQWVIDRADELGVYLDDKLGELDIKLVQKAEEVVAALNERADELQSELEKKAEQVGDQVEETLFGRAQEIETQLENKLDVVNTHIAETEDWLDAIDGKAVVAEQHLTTIENKASQVDQHLVDVENTIDSINEHLTVVDGKIVDANNDLDDLRGQIAQNNLVTQPTLDSTVNTLQTAIDGKAPSVHTHVITDVTNLQSTLDGKAPVSHSHTWGTITEKPSTFAPSAHTHAITDVVDLQSTLNRMNTVSSTGSTWLGTSSTNDDILEMIKNAGAGFRTFYAIANCINNPANEFGISSPVRGVFHNTNVSDGTATIGWVQAIDVQGNLYANYLNGGAWSGWIKNGGALPLSGGTMAGDINMSGKLINGISRLNASGSTFQFGFATDGGIRFNQSGTENYIQSGTNAFDSTPRDLTISGMNVASMDNLTFVAKNLRMRPNNSTKPIIQTKGDSSGSDANGFGIAIGTGGLTVIGSGESHTNIFNSIENGGTEQMYVTSDNSIYFVSNVQSGADHGVTMTYGTNGNLTVPGALSMGKGYFEVGSYNVGTYGEGKMQSFYDANARTWNIRGRDASNNSVAANLNLTGNITAANFQDSGWVTMTLLNGFTNYDDTASNQPKVRKIGKMVELRGVVHPPASNTLGSTTQTTICNLPSGYAPSTYVRLLMHGSGRAVWLLSVNPNGIITASRYREDSAYQNPADDAWMPFSVMYIVD